MDEKIVLPPTPATLDSTRLLYQVTSGFLEERKTIRGLGKYEADREGLVMMYLLIRYVEGVIALAEHDLVLLPSAMVLTRSAFETATRGRWMLHPKDPFEREVRWLAHLKGNEEYLNRLIEAVKLSGQDSSQLAAEKREFESFRMGITALLPKQVAPLKQLPTFREMLHSIGEEHYYAQYATLSNYTHGNYVATWTYRQHLGTYTQVGDFVAPEMWGTCFRMCWFCLTEFGRRVLERLNGDPNAFIIKTNNLVDEFRATLDRIETKTP